MISCTKEYSGYCVAFKFVVELVTVFAIVFVAVLLIELVIEFEFEFELFCDNFLSDVEVFFNFTWLWGASLWIFTKDTNPKRMGDALTVIFPKYSVDTSFVIIQDYKDSFMYHSILILRSVLKPSSSPTPEGRIPLPATLSFRIPWTDGENLKQLHRLPRPTPFSLVVVSLTRWTR